MIDGNRETKCIRYVLFHRYGIGLLLTRLASWDTHLAAIADQGFHLAHIKPTLDNLLRKPLRFRVSYKCPCMTRGNLSGADGGFDEFGEPQETQRVGDVAAAFAHDLGNIILMVFEFAKKRLVARGLFKRIQVFALHVFHDRQLKRLGIADVENNHRNFVQSCTLRRLPTPFAGDDFIGLVGAPPQRAYGDRLNDTPCFDGTCEFIKLSERKFAARIARIGAKKLIGTRRWPRTRSEGVLVSAPMSPIRDARPRPSRDRVDSSAIAASPEKSFTSFASSPYSYGRLR